MALTRPDSRQIINRAALKALGAAAGTTQDSIDSKVNLEADSPLRLAASFPTADSKLNFSASLLSTADGASKVLPPLSSQVFDSIAALTIDFQTQALSDASKFIISFPASTVGQFRRAGFTLTSAGKIQVLFSAEAASEGALANPGTLMVTGIPLGYVNLVCTNAAGQFKTAGSATNIIENAKIFRFGTGGGAGSSGSGSGTGDDIDTLTFRASFSDDFSDSPNASTSAVDTTRTNATYDAVAAAYRMSYDATRTITGTGTAMTLSGAPAFTVAAGDVVVNLVTLEVRRIASLSSQTSYTLESAFASDPTAVAVCVSQAVHTNDVRAHTENSTGLAINAVISDNVSTYMLRYRDTAAASDAIWDFPGAALVAFSVSADNSNWSGAQTRETALSTTMPIRSVSVAGSQFKARFFANATSGSGAVNVLDYKVFMHADASSTSSGAVAYKAVARTDNAGTGVNASVSSSTGKTRITTTFAFNSEVQVWLDGKKIPEFVDTTVTPDASFTRISGNVIQLDDDYSALGLQIEVIVPSTTVDNTNANASNISALQDMATAGLQGMVDESAQLSAVNGAPSTGQFRTFGIVNRASIPDIANNLKARMAIERVMIQQLVLMPNESGPNGENVFGSSNDSSNLFRFVGSSWANIQDSSGAGFWQSLNNDYIEVVFYGTGLNMLLLRPDSGATTDIRVTVDGGSEGANVYTNQSSALTGRNYAPNVVLPLVSGLTLGLHTVKIRTNNTGSFGIRGSGFEILIEQANVNVRPGVAFVGGKKLVRSAASDVAYNSGTFDSVLQQGASVAFSTTRGARVIEYIKSDGSRGKSAYLVNPAQANLGSADHTYEEVIRKYYWREFGAGRSDDFSTKVAGSNDNRAFVLDDDTTTLIAQGINLSVVNGLEGPNTNNSLGSDFVSITFVGTGLDILTFDNSSGGTTYTYDVTVDGGASIGTIGNDTSSTSLKRRKIVSGLPYGTHVVKFRWTVNNVNLNFHSFIVYGPKKPTLPAGAVELCDYNVMADFVPNTVTGVETISGGVLRKQNFREVTLVGTWTNGGVATGVSGGISLSTNTNGDYYEYQFFGTGFDIRLSGGSWSGTLTVDGSSNLSGFTTSSYSSGGTFSFTPATGAVSATSVTADSNGIIVRGLTLGVHKVRFTRGASGASGLTIPSLDLIVPIHAPKSNIPADVQNTLPIGSQGISDSRRLSLIKSEDPKKVRVVAYAVTSDPSTSSTNPVPLPEMSTTIVSKGAWFEILGVNPCSNSGGNTQLRIYVNGVQLGQLVQQGTDGSTKCTVITDEVYLAPGVHKVDLYWSVNAGTATSNSLARRLTVKEL